MLGVCQSSVVLAEIQGLDPAKAALAALLHDIAKETPNPELARDLARRGRPIDPEDEDYPKLWHALAAAVWAEQDFGVGDAEILEAIRLHPTADGPALPLARVLFLADYTDPTRDWSGAAELRRLARDDFDAAMAQAVRQKIEYVRSRGYAIHPRALRALETYGAGACARLA
ncbi:MAG: putative nicotinate-nucleotide adenylyltransferase [candidate division BRC1 bacterium ADurb.BinA364]|nr:MAG: putative nicotinate-nucleotide adenylyltransferase [candidate division BRC1 bacterium ADurb.BinA364]